MNRLIVNALKSVGLVTSGDDPEAQVTFWKSNEVDKRDFSTEQRENLADKGQALPDGSFPIASKQDLANAIKAFGRAGNKEAAKRHIIKRARALGATEMLPESWNVTKVSTSAGSATVNEGDGMPMDLSAIDDADLRKSIEDAIEGLEAQIAEQAEKLTELDPPDPIEKADDEVRQLIEKERAERETLQKKLDEEVAKRRVSEFVAKARPLEALIGKADEMGPVLEELERKAPEAYAKLDGALTAASQRSELSALFAKYGTEGDAEGDPIGRRDAFVKSYLAENPGKSEVEARAEFWTRNPDAKQDLRS